MKRNRIQFETNGEYSSSSPAGGGGGRVPQNIDDDTRNNSRHIPKISRKIRACTECKRHKVRCDMKTGDQICQRCQRMGLQCVVNKSLQTLLDDEAEWKTMIELAMSDLLRKAQLPELSYYQAGGPSPPQTRYNERSRKLSTASVEAMPHMEEHTQTNGTNHSRRPSSGYRTHREQSHYSPEREEPGQATLVTAPMGSLFEVTQLSHSRGNSPTRQHAPDRMVAADLISRGVVDLAEAEELFAYFDSRLNHYLWDSMVMNHANLMSVRQSSTLLTAAVLAVTALHIPKKERVFDTCYAEFARLASDSMLNRHHSLDDLRALCIGAFWLSDVSWKLSGYAVRIATERNLHQCYRKAIQGSPEHREQTQLWYILYILEHHFSIAYGRPPIIHEDTCITNHEIFLNHPSSGQRDIRVHSQVALFIVLTRIYHAFGPDVDVEVLEHELPRIEEFDKDLENWRRVWRPRITGNPYLGDYPFKAVNLNYNFSRLTLNSTALRTYHCATSTRPLSAARKKHAEVAINSAIATLTVVLDEPEVQESLVGTQLFLHSMITFAAVFLLKIAVKAHPNCIIGPNSQRNSLAAAGLNIDIPYVLEVIEKIVKIMISASEKASERHVSHHIARGLGKMLEGFREWEQRNTQHSNGQPLRPQPPSWVHDTPSLFSTVSLTNPQTLGGRATICNHPPPMLGVAPLSSERGNTTATNNNSHNSSNHNNHTNHNNNSNAFPPSSSTAYLSAKSQIGLSEGSLDPMMTDMWGFEEEYFPMGVFDFLQSQMPA
ncbi:fungal specific transcription factor, putative [Talaromyces stipitatus ATCC 10500]|uniref:Fungal specific transcription factor, putative n=1 Tax=Talaromyces stipitatus (strain ATCC 10500 / CBS 375.48 / QM 6759 / NRRL 1006) TaxID=441959 RepID=B8MNF3_TALSN|nr:fungal specific transcription factor, putative [Talaromyces stipitatus ATCC 10500]EED14042.1 fungal specific transcription factor, putative [Talaromyces stipitatus ATCC 10500]